MEMWPTAPDIRHSYGSWYLPSSKDPSKTYEVKDEMDCTCPEDGVREKNQKYLQNIIGIPTLQVLPVLSIPTKM